MWTGVLTSISGRQRSAHWPNEWTLGPQSAATQTRLCRSQLHYNVRPLPQCFPVTTETVFRSEYWMLNVTAIKVSKMTSHCAGTEQMREESESGIRKWEEMWFKTTAEDGERGAAVTCKDCSTDERLQQEILYRRQSTAVVWCMCTLMSCVCIRIVLLELI